jgi:hypothetical protein
MSPVTVVATVNAVVRVALLNQPANVLAAFVGVGSVERVLPELSPGIAATALPPFESNVTV